jgi:putative flippase GtrA
LKFEDLITKAELNPKKLFLIDGCGAFLSAFFLGFVLIKLEELFGIPSSVLYFLASIPIFYVMYDFYCYWKHLKIGLLLKGIAVLNLVYCCISIGIISYYFNTIKMLGWTYIIVEIILIIFLAMIEFRVGEKIIKRISSKN